MTRTHLPLRRPVSFKIAGTLSPPSQSNAGPVPSSERGSTHLYPLPQQQHIKQETGDKGQVSTLSGAMALCTGLSLLALLFFGLCHAAPTPATDFAPSANEQTAAEDYLSQFYRDVGTTNSTARRIPLTSFKNDLEAMQSFFGLEVTGVLDNKTLEVMKESRCGVSDISKYGHFHGKPKWPKTTITYRVTQYSPDLRQSEVDATLAKAFKLYSDISPLNFEQIQSGTADIMILFKAGDHGDFYPFDGPSGVLAHANSPGRNQGGDTHFDEDENWSLTRRGVNLLLVAAHEFGHALGLDHSRDRKALMFPTYQYVDTDGYKLPDDDKEGIQALYGSRTPTDKPEPEPEPDQPTPDPEPTDEPTPDPKPDPKPDPRPDPRPNPKDEQCSRDLVFDAATSIRRELYFFKNGYFWKKSGYFSGVKLKQVKHTWPQINYVDAAYEIKSKDTAYLFEGSRYWGVIGYKTLPGYPKSISNFGFPSYVTKIDAAVHVAMTGKTLFFVNNKYWSYDESRGQMDQGYPRYIFFDFPGIGLKVDAVFDNYGYLYFSNGARQAEYHYSTRRIIRVLLNYGWLDCY
ncbi:hypothetical protein SKAU_G00088400 [Synaphobranchus kaupii]|uniref:Peptidase metallopeptidase domain-containing protein n=1 Tax=Synaphobranchus kaupii TaxID=118154 RepID=A0A9Q1FWM3_SYNKA|nr:hypothetical protein SKAU_G00088400 [Synaphobranchus kaupii]